MNDQGIWPYDARKLLQGERVEVRQKEKGLRGSWHPATIVGLKPGRRLVEYDELLTEDGLHKLRESIPVTKSSETMRGSPYRTTFSPRRNEACRNTCRLALLSPPPKSRGFLRPLPPVCNELSPQSWKRGFMVDVFFQDAWWEAVLLEDIISPGDDIFIKVMFPDEGDEGRVSFKNLRISQDWDEDTGQWSVKGTCNLSAFLRRGANGRKKMVPSDQNKTSEVITHDDSSVADGESKDCRAERDQGCPAPSITIQEGGKPERKENHQAPADNIQGVSRAPSNERGIGGELMGGGLVEHLPVIDCANKEDGNNQEPVQFTCLEHCREGSPYSMPSLCAFNGLSGSRGVVPCRKEGDPVENLELRSDTDVHENPERCFQVDRFRNGGDDGREETDDCTLAGGGSGTFEVLPKKSLIEADIQPDIRGQGEEACGSSLHEQGRQSVDSLQSVTITTVQECVDGTSQTNSFGILDIGKIQCQRNLSLSTQSHVEVHNGKEFPAKETDAETRLDSPCSIEQGDPNSANQLVTGKKKVGRPSKSGAGIGKGKFLSESDKPGKLKAGSKEERLRRGLMRIEMASVKSRMSIGGRPLNPKTNVESDAEEKNSLENEDVEGLDGLKEIRRRDGKQRSCSSEVVKQTGALNGKVRRMGRRDKTDAVLDTLRHCSKLVKTEGTTSFFKTDPKNKTTRVSILKNLVRDIAKEALQEAGFRIEFRPRREKDYEDPVYVSPEGRTYWSLPNAWRAWKKSQGLEGQMISTQPGLTGAVRSVGSPTGSGSCRHGGKGRPPFKTDKDILLQAAVEQVGFLSIGDKEISQDDLKQLHLTNSQLADLFLEDFCVLKRTIRNGRPKSAKKKSAREFQNKGFQSKNGVVVKTAKHSLAEFVDESRGKKCKRDVRNSADKVNKKILGRKLSFSRERPECGTSSEKSRPYKGGRLFKKGGKGSKDIGTPVKVESRLLLKPGLPGFSSKKLGSKPLERKKPLVRCVKSGKRHNSDVENGFEYEPPAKKRRVTPKEKTLADSILMKKQRVLLQRHLPLGAQSEGKNSKVIHNRKQKNQKGRSGLRLEVRAELSRKCDGSEASLFNGKQTILSWMIDRGVILEREKLSYINRENNQVLKKALVSREGIFCTCCKRIYTISNFTVHAGSHAGQPGQNIIFASGRSFVDCQQQAWASETELRKTDNYVGVTVDDRNDDTCLLCGDGGDLLCCDHCPSTFHTSCLEVQDVPEGDWCCPKCSCAACISISQNDCEKDLAMKEMLSCSQCEHQYHNNCMQGGSIVAGSETFCGKSCQKIFTDLRNLVGISHPLDRGFSWTLLRCMAEDWESHPPESVEAIAEQHSKLAVALLVMQECFVPMEDPRTNIDMITHVVYNRRSEFDRLNYGGFYTAILEREDEIISAASVRIHGESLAEMPLIGTRQQYRRQGMCRLLVSEIEKVLESLEVETFVLPAIPELLETWTYAFGFQPLDASQRLKNRNLSMMVFPGTQLLQKSLLGSKEVDPLSTENAALEKSDSCLEILQSTASLAADGIKDADICHTNPGTSFSSSDVLDCKKAICSVLDCTAPRLDTCIAESETDLEWQSCTKRQGVEEACYAKVDRTSVPCEFVDTSGLCIVNEASKQLSGLPDENKGWRIKATSPGPVLPENGELNCLETPAESVQADQMYEEGSHDDLSFLGLFNGLASPGEMIPAGDGQKMLQPLSERFSHSVSGCQGQQLDESNMEMGPKSTRIAEKGSSPCCTHVDEQLFQRETLQDSEGMCKESMDPFAAPRLDRYLSQTYGRKRWRHVGNANSPIGSQLNCDAQALSTTKGSQARNEADAMSSGCLNFDNKDLAHNSGVCQVE